MLHPKIPTPIYYTWNLKWTALFITHNTPEPTLWDQTCWQIAKTSPPHFKPQIEHSIFGDKEKSNVAACADFHQ